MSYPYAKHTTSWPTRPPGALVTSAGDWQVTVVQHYRRRRQREAAALRAALAQRLRALIGREVGDDTIWVDLDERTASATVDGVRFRYAQSELTLLRPCVHCGIGQFASPPLANAADVGYALAAWQPHHPNCEAEDPVE